MEIELSILYEKRVSSFWLSPELFNRRRTDIATTKKSMTHILRNSDFTYGTLKAQGFSGGSMVKNPPTNAEDMGSIPGFEDPLEREMTTHSSILAWEVPWRVEPGGLQAMGLQKESDTN